jgi:UPF0755 protein
MKRFFTFLLPVLFLIAGTAFGTSLWWRENTKPISNDSSLQRFVVLKGEAAQVVGQKLKDEGLIKSALAFKIYLQVSGKQLKILAGEHRLSPSFSLSKVVEELTKGPGEVWVTIPEGLRREEIVERYITTLDKKDKEATSFRQEFMDLTKEKEGYLFPDTYLFPKTANAQLVVNKMLTVFDQKVDPLIPRTLVATRYGLSEYIILASLIERETRTDEERPVVAGILYKRMEKGWPLEIDASLQYAVASSKCQNLNSNCSFWGVVTSEDKKINSPYNLYKNLGLPPGPIANPGLSSIKAVINPEESPYWFYLHDSKGQIHYAKTGEEHNKNIQLFLGS